MQPFKLTKAEQLQLINLRPLKLVELYVVSSTYLAALLRAFMGAAGASEGSASEHKLHTQDKQASASTDLLSCLALLGLQIIADCEVRFGEEVDQRLTALQDLVRQHLH